MQNNIPSIVLTGGPCAGKSSALAELQEYLTELGFTPLIVKETPTELMEAGAEPGKSISVEGFQGNLFTYMMGKEEVFFMIAGRMSVEGKKPVIIFDRGLMDIKAYTSSSLFYQLCESHSVTEVEIRDSRYTAVIHLRSVACGAEKFYTRENNTKRLETLEEARGADERVLRAWLGCPHLDIVENPKEGGFKEKMLQVKKSVARVLGIPEPLEIEKKFLLERRRIPRKLPVPSVMVDIEQTYLISRGDVFGERVRRRGVGGVWVYFHTQKTPAGLGTRIEKERIISRREYDTFLKFSDPLRQTIRKKRICFVYENQHFELDLFDPPHPKLAVLEIELNAIDDPIVMPPFLDVVRDVTDEDEYSNYQLAAR
jgi:CYTH domain-containing protein/predicted ATPase